LIGLPLDDALPISTREISPRSTSSAVGEPGSQSPWHSAVRLTVRSAGSACAGLPATPRASVRARGIARRRTPVPFNAKSRQKVWGAIMLAESRSDGQVGRSIVTRAGHAGGHEI